MPTRTAAFVSLYPLPEGEGICGALPSAYAAKARLVLAQQAVDGKSNEITAIPQVLGLLELEGAVVSVDAMGCQKAIADKINRRARTTC